jgi:hypothetical protein
MLQASGVDTSSSVLHRKKAIALVSRLQPPPRILARLARIGQLAARRQDRLAQQPAPLAAAAISGSI